MRTSGQGDKQRPCPIPDHWIGVRKEWEHSCQSLGEALVPLTPEQMKTHTLVIGATGSGKTNVLHHLLVQDLQNGCSVVVLDARGDLAGAAIELAARAHVDPRKVRFFNLREKVRPWGFNPLAGDGEPYYRALSVLDAVAAQSDSWGVQLAETLRNALLLLAEGQTPLAKLEALLHDAAFRRSCLATCANASVCAFWERYGLLSSEKQSALAAPVLNKVSLLLATEPLRRLFGHQAPVDLTGHLNNPGSITLVSLAVDELHGAGWMAGRIFLSSICREIFARVDVAESFRNPVRLYVDEFEHFGLGEFETILAEGRRFKFSLVLAHQTLAQLSPKMRSMILGNVGAKIVFRSGRQDAEVLNKDLTGDSKAFDLASLPTGDAVLWRRGEVPIYIEVNAPLIDDVGQVSSRAKRYRERLLALTPPYVPEFYSASSRQVKEEAPEPPDADPGGPLEEWL
jgi:hypothetical protein